MSDRLHRNPDALGWLANTGRVVSKSKVWKFVGEPSEPKGGAGGHTIHLGTAGRTSPGDRDARRIAENLRYTTEEPK